MRVTTESGCAINCRINCELTFARIIRPSVIQRWSERTVRPPKTTAFRLNCYFAGCRPQPGMEVVTGRDDSPRRKCITSYIIKVFHFEPRIYVFLYRKPNSETAVLPGPGWLRQPRKVEAGPSAPVISCGRIVPETHRTLLNPSCPKHAGYLYLHTMGVHV